MRSRTPRPKGWLLLGWLLRGWLLPMLPLSALLGGCVTPAGNLSGTADALPTAPSAWRYAPAPLPFNAAARGAPEATGTSAAPDTTVSTAAVNTDATLAPDWWRGFDSPELNTLIDAALRQNTDLAIAMARVRRAAALRGAADAAAAPSLDGQLRGGADGRVDGTRDTTSSVTFSARHDVDLWGGQRARRTAAQARLQESRFDRAAMRQTVLGAVVDNYLRTLGLREQTRLAAQTAEAAQHQLQLVEARVAAGAVTPLDLARQRTQVAASHRAHAALAQQADAALIAVAVLLGRPVAQFEIEGQTLDDLRLPRVNAGIPSTLLTRRPDIARAEARLAGAAADVAAARAALLPGVQLQATLSFEQGRLPALFDNPAYSLASALLAPIFDGGRRAAQVDVARAERQALLDEYRKTIIAAFGATENAFNAVAMLARQHAAIAVELREAHAAALLADSRYQAGADTFDVVLEAQRTLYATQQAASRLRLDRLCAAAALIAALGGGALQSSQPWPPSENADSTARVSVSG